MAPGGARRAREIRAGPAGESGAAVGYGATGGARVATRGGVVEGTVAGGRSATAQRVVTTEVTATRAVPLASQGCGDRPGVRGLGVVPVREGKGDTGSGDGDHSGDARQGEQGVALAPMPWSGGSFRHFIVSSVYRAVVSFPSLPVPDRSQWSFPLL